MTHVAYCMEYTLEPLDCSDCGDDPPRCTLCTSRSSGIGMPCDQSPDSYNIVSVMADI